MRTLLQMLRSNRGSTEELDGDVVAAQAYEEQDAEKEGREPVDLIAKFEEDEAKAEAERKAEEDAETQDEDSELDIDKKDEDDQSKKEDDETEDDDSKPAKEDDEDSETQDSDKDAEITAHAEKHSMSYAEAKEDIDKTNTIIEQFKNDPKEMARALRNKDREYDKLRNEQEKAKEDAKDTGVFKALTREQYKVVAQEKVDADPEKFLNAFKEFYPAKSQLMSDEAIIEEMIDREWSTYQVAASKEEAKVTKSAESRRESIITDIPKEDRRFLPDVKAFLEGVPDSAILQKSFDPSYILQLAKGKSFEAEIKAAEERGYKRGSEGSKILGIKNGGDGTGPVSKGTGKGLTEAQKYRAEEMFMTEDGYSPEDAYKEFRDTFKDELKDNPRFV